MSAANLPCLPSISSSSSSSSPRLSAVSRSIPVIAFPLHRTLSSRGVFTERRNRRKKATAASLRSQERVLAVDSSALSDFWQWTRENGVSAPAVDVKLVSEGLGLVAQKDLGRNDTVVEVPKRLWINMDSVAADADMRRLISGRRPWVAIALFLLREKARGVDSFWKPYLDILPSSTNSPLFWSEQELSELQGTQLLSTVLGFKDFLKTEFLKVEEEVLKPYSSVFPSTVTFEDFIWAFGIIRSRTFPGLDGDNLTLIPVADLVNHSSKVTSIDSSWEIRAKGLFSREEIFSLRTPLPVKVGEQVHIQYNLQKSNAELALDYGFIDKTPDRDSYTFTLEIPESQEFLDDKLDIAESKGLTGTSYFDIYLDQTLPPLMIPYLRLIALGGQDSFLLEALFRNSVWGHLELPVSYQNEELVCRVMRDACESALSGYRTTIEEDDAILEDENSDKRLEIAAWIRRSEKKILRQVDSAFEEREKELDILEYYQERRLKDLGLVGEQGDIIFWE